MQLQRLLALYRRHFRDPRRERMFLASLGFFVTFALTRLTTHHLRDNVSGAGLLIGGTHVHHLVWGIVLLLAVGYLSMIQPGAGDLRAAHRYGRVTSLLFAMGAALTLDEFALWLNLRDVYWTDEGRASIDAVMLFGALVSVGLWGGPFVRALGRQLLRPWRRLRPLPPSGAHAAIAEPIADPRAR